MKRLSKKAKIAVVLIAVLFCAAVVVRISVSRQSGDRQIEWHVNQNGDEVLFEYAGHAYAKLNEEEGYRVIGEIEEEPLSKIRRSTWWLYPFNIYGYKEDAEHLFWYGDFNDWLTFGNVYYREDIVIPKLKSENVKSIDVFEQLEPYAVRDDLKNFLPVLSISERDEVNKILDSFSKAKDRPAFIDEFFETYLKSEVKDNQEKDYMVYATFYDYPILRYCIGGCIA